MIERVCHIGPALDVQGGISSVLVSYKKLFGLPRKNFIASYNGSFVSAASLEGMPEAGDIKPSIVYKPMRPKTKLIPYDEERVLELNAQRDDLPKLYENPAEVTDIPDGLIFKNGLRMNSESAAELMRITANDLG